eukprot:gnl/Chilomastix_caulleri/5189.p3 GENE.gnl/Chilomastix_caulleri/5189~~gnl/Chilomastix_caulleri/5189.p3  ORF type:complete len:73 (-),score=17.80 gnl/Chilomastix_caulleri/5189:250-468(-)
MKVSVFALDHLLVIQALGKKRQLWFPKVEQVYRGRKDPPPNTTDKVHGIVTKPIEGGVEACVTKAQAKRLAA